MKESYPAKVTCGSSTARTTFNGLPSGEPVADGAISRFGPLEMILALPEHYDGFVEVIPRCQVCGRIKSKPTAGLQRHLFCVAERKPPFSPDAVIEEYVALDVPVHQGLWGSVRRWMAEGEFHKRSVYYEPAEKPKSELYRDLLPLINSGAVDLLENERLIVQLTQLERRTARGGKDSIDHTPGAHDDVANAVAGTLVTAFRDPGIPGFDRPLDWSKYGRACVIGRATGLAAMGVIGSITALIWER
jgi:hypothetical protein